MTQDLTDMDDTAARKTKLFHDYYLAVNEARLEDGRTAIRTALLINGGAATAVLGFANSLLSKGSAAIALHLALGLTFFALGVLFAGLAAVLAYVTNYNAAENTAVRIIRDELPSAGETRPSGWLRYAAISLTGLSLMLFMAGAICAARAVLLG